MLVEPFYSLSSIPFHLLLWRRLQSAKPKTSPSTETSDYKLCLSCSWQVYIHTAAVTAARRCQGFMKLVPTAKWGDLVMCSASWTLNFILHSHGLSYTTCTYVRCHGNFKTRFSSQLRRHMHTTLSEWKLAGIQIYGCSLLKFPFKHLSWWARL